jgi:hypothetical protein
MVLALALPCCLPFVYLIPQIVALPILVLTGQMASGRHVPWLPEKLNTRDFDDRRHALGGGAWQEMVRLDRAHRPAPPAGAVRARARRALSAR